jgi:hypothetical protein
MINRSLLQNLLAVVCDVMDINNETMAYVVLVPDASNTPGNHAASRSSVDRDVQKRL